MLIRLHQNATTTPAIREHLRTRPKGVKTLARELNLNVATVRQWRGRDSTEDASHRPHRMQTTLSPAQAALVVELRRTVLLSLDDLVAVTRAHLHPDASRAAIGRLLKREGVSRLADLVPAEEGAAAPKKTFKDYAPGYLHVDLKALPRMPDEAAGTYLGVAIDRASRWVYFEILPDKTAQGTQGFLERLAESCPFQIEKRLTDNGKAFTDRFTAQGERAPTGHHPVDQACQAIGAEHRLIPPGHPQTFRLCRALQRARRRPPQGHPLPHRRRAIHRLGPLPKALQRADPATRPRPPLPRPSPQGMARKSTRSLV